MGASRQQSKEIRYPPKRTTPKWSHAAVACMADGQPSALGTGCHPGSETPVGLQGQQQLYVRRSHIRSEPYHDELHTFRRETERRRHCGNERWICAVAECRCRHDMMKGISNELCKVFVLLIFATQTGIEISRSLKPHRYFIDIALITRERT